MKKKTILFIVLLITIVSFNVIYRSYVRKRINDYIILFTRPSGLNFGIGTEDNVEIENIIKQTPQKLIFLIKWGDNKKAYISIEGWATRAHDTIVIHIVDRTIRLIE